MPVTTAKPADLEAMIDAHLASWVAAAGVEPVALPTVAFGLALERDTAALHAAATLRRRIADLHVLAPSIRGAVLDLERAVHAHAQAVSRVALGLGLLARRWKGWWFVPAAVGHPPVRRVRRPPAAVVASLRAAHIAVEGGEFGRLRLTSFGFPPGSWWFRDPEEPTGFYLRREVAPDSGRSPGVAEVA
jgi:hypothetical protein